MDNIKIKLNGQEVELPQGAVLQDLLNIAQIKEKMFVAEKNLQIINRENYSLCLLEDGDNIEIVGFFGGG